MINDTINIDARILPKLSGEFIPPEDSSCSTYGSVGFDDASSVIFRMGLFHHLCLSHFNLCKLRRSLFQLAGIEN